MNNIQKIIGLILFIVLLSGCEDKGYGTQDINVVPSVTTTQDMTIINSIPKENGNVAQRAYLHVAFSSYIDEATVTTSQVRLEDINDSIDLPISFLVVRNFLYIKPLTSLIPTKHYKLHISGLQDIFGNVLAQSYEFSYVCDSDFWEEVVAGNTNAMAKSKVGDLYIWGSNAPLPLDTNEEKSIFLSIDMPLPVPKSKNVKSFATGTSGMAIATQKGELVNIGAHAYTDLENFDYKAVGIGRDHSVVLKEDGTIYSWGSNSYGQLGNLRLLDQEKPEQEYTEATDWSAISTRTNFTLALKEDGSLWGWGDNSEGELGNPYDIVPLPKPIDTNGTNISKWKQVSAGGNHTVALGDDNTTWSWGKNSSGELGNASFEQSRTAVQEASTSKWSFISAGFDHTVAIRDDGTLWAWGNNGSGQLGDNNTGNSNIPVQEASSVTTWITIGAGNKCTFGIKDDGTLWTWGSNFGMRLGLDDSLDATSVPMEVK